MVVAQFKRLMVAAYGSCSAGYRALDKKNSKRLTQEQFVKGCKELGFSHGKTIFQAICHKPGVRVMIQHDIQFMDEWDPPEWLLEDPSEKDAFDFVQTHIAGPGQKGPPPCIGDRLPCFLSKS